MYTNKLVTVFGGSGFLGRYVVRELAERGYRVRVACRRPDLAGHVQPSGDVGQIQFVQANLRYRWSIDRAVEGADIVVNTVGILAATGKQTFDSLQARGAGWVSEAAAAAGAKMVHVSAIGADEQSKADYARTKALGEDMVRKASPDAIIMRPSIIFGPEDDFFNRFAGMARIAPALPLIGGGKSRFQPVYVGDVAKAIANAADEKLEAGSTWELGGPEVLTFRECMERMLDVIDRKRALVSLPFPIASAMGSLLQFAPGAPITPGQVEMLKSDNVVSDDSITQNRTLEDAGVEPTALSAVLPTYLVRFRKHGQFEANRGL
ncbi:complex I NDUFA9 subunit family protein [Ahrensia sp. R2A130]|uniref:complex I NDUFA9 subunit family protein n=1 Tax=Ahrensia sp. R2A130 TaxID=744979 RepID=UPI0001E0C322|nr:complex I NDUFA9 subunit family protein [Ahrensia sp. R2A130]EFL90794.1 NADH dehydrogenase (ubiquinone) 1 alpha subcomplex subunit 9 [Ahrensia sp. R2A130]